MGLEGVRMAFQDELDFDQGRKVTDRLSEDMTRRMQRTNCGNQWPVWPKHREE